MVRVGDGRVCSSRFPDGQTFEHEKLGHGYTTDGSPFVDHVKYFVGTHLGDWRW